MVNTAKTIRIEKVRRIEKLSKKDQEELVLDLVNALVQAKNINDVVLFLQDLLTRNEMRVLSRRLRIAKLLIKGMTYEEIEIQLHTSHATVAKIAVWLSERGDGFRKIIEKLPKQSDVKSWQEYSDLDKFKRRYSLYFWPELLLEEIVKNANSRQKDRIRNVLEKLDRKSELHKTIDKLLSQKV